MVRRFSAVNVQSRIQTPDYLFAEIPIGKFRPPCFAGRFLDICVVMNYD